MGKGDKKTKRGKIIKGSFGVKRPKKLKNKLTTMGVEKEKVVKKPSKPKAIKGLLGKKALPIQKAINGMIKKLTTCVNI